MKPTEMSIGTIYTDKLEYPDNPFYVILISKTLYLLVTDKDIITGTLPTNGFSDMWALTSESL